MKKMIYILGVIFASFFMVNGVKADTKVLYSCKYEYNFSKLIPTAKDATTTFYADVTDGKEASISSFSELNNTAGYFGGNTFYWRSNKFLAWGSTFAEEYNTAAKKDDNNVCPDILLTHLINTNQIRGSLTSISTEEYESAIVSGEIVNSQVENNKREEICTRTSSLRNHDYQIKISFSKIGNSNEWKVSGNGEDSGWQSLDAVIADKSGNDYTLVDDAKTKFFESKDSCINTPLYLMVKGQPSIGAYSMNIQTTKPSDVDNGAYSSTVAGNDDGKHDVVIDPNPPDIEYGSGCDILGGEGSKTVQLIDKIYGYFTWIIPLLIVALSILDFVKVVTSGDEKDYHRALNNLFKRIIIGIVFFLVPILVKLIINISGITETITDGDNIIKTIACILK